ncbi:hypothetical protein N7454_008632 [Penicillium verhagenii]|nr:hypothetical protein N7454_008632 [Penicillium verhagenii]
MWKSLITTGQQATRRTRPHQTLGLWKPPLSSATRGAFGTTSQCQKTANNAESSLKDREKLDPDRSEGTKSGTDSEVAQHPSAYDPHNTAPESELEAVGKEKQSQGVDANPLNMSPANSDVSAWREPTEGGPDRNVEKEATSAKGAPKKRRSIHVKDDGTHVSYQD